MIAADAFGSPCAPLTRVAAIAVFRNPLAAAFTEGLSLLLEIGAELDARLADELKDQLRASGVSCGKAALVGFYGDMDHGGAVIQPKSGAPVRAVVSGGQAVIPFNVKIGAPGCAIDLPLAIRTTSGR